MKSDKKQQGLVGQPAITKSERFVPQGSLNYKSLRAENATGRTPNRKSKSLH
jgi:hypothetical protein